MKGGEREILAKKKIINVNKDNQNGEEEILSLNEIM
jgi:hypothetical protein